MKTKSVISIFLLVFVATSMAYLVVSESRSSVGTTDATETGQQIPPGKTLSDASAISAPSDAEHAGVQDADVKTNPKLIAYYFHRAERCRTCLTIEAYALETLKESFTEAMETGEIEWRTVNLEEPAHEHFVEDYQLTASALVFVNTNRGEQEQWRNLERVWELVSDELEFKIYVEAEARALLEENS